MCDFDEPAAAVATVNAVVQRVHTVALPAELLMPNRAALKTDFEVRLAQPTAVVLLTEAAGEACGDL